MTSGTTPITTMTSPTGRVVVVAPRGQLTLDDCPSLRDALRAALPSPPSTSVAEMLPDGRQGAALLVVDLLDVEHLDACVVEVLVGASTRCAAHGVRFVVANANEQPWQALTRARVAGVLRLHRRGAEPLADLLAVLEL